MDLNKNQMNNGENTKLLGSHYQYLNNLQTRFPSLSQSGP